MSSAALPCGSEQRSKLWDARRDGLARAPGLRPLQRGVSRHGESRLQLRPRLPGEAELARSRWSRRRLLTSHKRGKQDLPLGSQTVCRRKPGYPSFRSGLCGSTRAEERLLSASTPLMSRCMLDGAARAWWQRMLNLPTGLFRGTCWTAQGRLPGVRAFRPRRW